MRRLRRFVPALVCAAAGALVPPPGAALRAQTPAAATASQGQAGAPARIKIDIDRTIGTVDPLLFGNFSEHLGRMIYGGIYDEKSPLSDASGYRKDVMEFPAHSLTILQMSLR